MEAGVWGVAPRAGEAIAAELIRRRQKIDQDELGFSCLAAQFAATDEYDEQGFDSPISWLKAVCRMSGGAAADRVCVGDQVERLGQSTAAMAAGEIGFAHLALIARTSAALSERLDEARLLSHARKLNIFPFRNTCLHARHAGDPEGFVNEEKEGVEARSLTLTTSDDGVVLVQGLLDKVGGAAWRMRSSTSRCTRSTTAWCRSGRICRSRVPWKRSWVYLKRRRRRWSSRSRSHPRLSSGWRATAASPASCSTPSPWSSTSGARSGSCLPRRARRSRSEIVAVSGQDAIGRQPGLRRITSCTGFMVGRPTFPTWSSCVTGITAWSMRATGS